MRVLACLFVAMLLNAQPLQASEGVTSSMTDPARMPVKRVGVLIDNYPYSYLGPDGNIHGFAAELVRAIEPHVALRFEYVRGTTNEINHAFREGKIDILQSFASSQERERFCAFSKPYLPMDGAIIVRKGTKGIRSLEDLRGKKVLVHKSSLGEATLIQAGMEASIIYADTVEDALRKLDAGVGDATLATRLSAMSLCRRMGIESLDLIRTARHIYRAPYCIAVHRADQATLAQIEQALAVVNIRNRDGVSSYDEIYQKYFGFIDPPGYSALEIMVATSIGLAIALVVATWAYYQQRRLNLYIAKQAEALRKSEQQLRQTQKLEAIGTLAGGIAHDFNNILTGIIGNAELAKMDLPAQSELAGNLDEILKSSERARMLVRQILTFSRKAESKLEPLRLGPVISEVLRFLRATTPAYIDIKKPAEERQEQTLADANQVHQVLMNLCTNAIHAMKGKPGSLELFEECVDVGPEVVSLHPELGVGRYLRVGVKDTGCGMSPELLLRIFEPFFTTKNPGEGTGLGLSVVHGIMLKHGGAVTVYSHPGKGTLFHLYFPVISSEMSPGASSGAVGDAEHVPMGRGEMVLLIDDEPSITRTVEMLLRKLGYRVLSFNDAEEAIEAFNATPEHFDFVITDLTMPKMTGIDVALAIQRRNQKIPVLLASGYIGEKEADLARKAGILSVIDKPITQKALATCLASCRLS